MSRIGREPIAIPEGPEVSVDESAVVVRGPLGELRRTFPRGVRIAVAEGVVTVTPANSSKASRMLWGTWAAHVRNMIAGVRTKYEKQLIIEGIGYRAEVRGSDLVMQLGFSHPVTIPIPEGLTVSIDKESVSISGIDKEQVGGFAATVRAQKKPEPYKGKGIRYSAETVRRKQGKRATSTGA